MATHSSILACEIPWTEEPGGLLSTSSQELDTTEQLYHYHRMYKIDIILSMFFHLGFTVTKTLTCFDGSFGNSKCTPDISKTDFLR